MYLVLSPAAVDISERTRKCDSNRASTRLRRPASSVITSCIRRSRYWWWSRGFSAASTAQSHDESKVPGNNKNAQRCRHKHAEEHTDTHDILRAGARTTRLHQRHDTENESECRHQNWTEAQSCRCQRSILE